MDETRLRDQLARALSLEPPLGNVVGNSLRAGRKLRRRRRVGIVAVSAAAVAVVVAVPAVIVTAGTKGPATAADMRTAYVIGNDTVVPISLATNAVGKPIKVPPVGVITTSGTSSAAATPDGRTVYEVGVTGGYSHGSYSSYAVVTPIDTATDRPGRRITLPSIPCPPRSLERLSRCSLMPTNIVIEPNGRTAYVATDGGVYPINLARRAVGKLISVAAIVRTMAFTPDGQTLYVLGPLSDIGPDGRPVYPTGAVLPVRTASNTALAPIRLPKHTSGYLFDIAITPTGKTAYVVAGVGGKAYSSSVIPIDLQSNRALAPIRLKASGLAQGVVMSPGGGTAYVLSSRAVTPINTATDKAGPAINLPGSDGYASGIVLTPNGKTIYVVSPRGVIPIRTASRTVLPMIIVPHLPPFANAYVNPDGKTLYVDVGTGVVPISTATNKAGRLINIGAPAVSMIFVR
jgi:hypothetical protein